MTAPGWTLETLRRDTSRPVRAALASLLLCAGSVGCDKACPTVVMDAPELCERLDAAGVPQAEAEAVDVYVVYCGDPSADVCMPEEIRRYEFRPLVEGLGCGGECTYGFVSNLPSELNGTECGDALTGVDCAPPLVW